MEITKRGKERERERRDGMLEMDMMIRRSFAVPQGAPPVCGRTRQ